jgi:hypothetical protein
MNAILKHLFAVASVVAFVVVLCSCNDQVRLGNDEHEHEHDHPEPGFFLEQIFLKYSNEESNFTLLDIDGKKTIYKPMKENKDHLNL